MKHTGPIITLAAGVLVAAVLLVLNVNATNNNAHRDDPASTLEPTTPATTHRDPGRPRPRPPTPAAPPAGTYAGKVDGKQRRERRHRGQATAGGRVSVRRTCSEAWLQGEVAEHGSVDLAGSGHVRR